jgi:hypothetical protein
MKTKQFSKEHVDETQNRLKKRAYDAEEGRIRMLNEVSSKVLSVAARCIRIKAKFQRMKVQDDASYMKLLWAQADLRAACRDLVTANDLESDLQERGYHEFESKEMGFSLTPFDEWDGPACSYLNRVGVKSVAELQEKASTYKKEGA